MGILGTLASTALTGFIDYRTAAASRPAVYQPVDMSMGTLQNWWDDTGSFAPGAGGAGTTTSEVVIDNASGKCVGFRPKKSRKRRRRLATASDIKDLASLKAVLGGGKAFENYLAIHGRH